LLQEVAAERVAVLLLFAVVLQIVTTVHKDVIPMVKAAAAEHKVQEEMAAHHGLAYPQVDQQDR
jgi:hypothetical protein